MSGTLLAVSGGAASRAAPPITLVRRAPMLERSAGPSGADSPPAARRGPWGYPSAPVSNPGGSRMLRRLDDFTQGVASRIAKGALLAVLLALMAEASPLRAELPP